MAQEYSDGSADSPPARLLLPHLQSRQQPRKPICRGAQLRLLHAAVCKVYRASRRDLCYCLLRNHFHFLIRIRDPLDARTDPSRCFSNLFNAYARAFNRMYHRTGALFQRPFGRRAVTDDRYFVRLVTYIHHNPQHHGFVDDFCD